MILYFTGTGNSRWLAMQLAQQLQDEVVSLNDLMRSGRPLRVTSDVPYVIAAPIHAWRYPEAVEALLRDGDLQGNRQVYCIGAMGENSGRADKALRKLFTAKGMDFKGFCGVVMPNNYIAGWDVDTPEERAEMFSNAAPKIARLAESIRRGDPIAKDDKTPMAWLMSGIVNYGFRNYMLKSGMFTVSDQCVGCGTCADFCPAGCISVIDGKAVIGEGCVGCYGCIHRCPALAINVPGKTETRGRYLCPEE